MPTTVRPFLMFQGRAEEAMEFYVDLFDDAEITEIVRYGAGQLGAEGSVMRATFEIGDLAIMCIDSPVKHAFTFTPASSLHVECPSEAVLEHVYEGLTEGGKKLMPLDDYGVSRKFAWVTDRFGVSWQLNLA